jgi:hypothetical protein
LPTLDAASRRTLGLAAGLVLAAGLLGVPLGVDAAAANCKLALQSGEASPGSGTTETVTTFSVRVSWKANCAEPDAVTLRILGLSGTTVLGQGSTSTTGGTRSALYAGQFTIGTPGSWGYEFAVRESPSSPWLTLAGSNPGQIDITAVPPTPTPTPRPKPKPTPTPRPKAKPKPTATPTPKPTARPRPTPTREPEPGRAVEPTPATPTAPPPESSEPTPAAVTRPPPSFPSPPLPTDQGPDQTPTPRTAGGVLLPRGPADPPGPDLPLAVAPIPTRVGGFDLALLLLVWLISASAGSVLFAFALRRHADRHDEATLAFAAAMAGRGLPLAPDEIAEGKVEAPAQAHDPEALIPRWRRPSLQAARQSTYAEAGAGRPPLRFEAGVAVGALRVVAYRLVFVSDRPSDNEAVELGRLDRGDHVDLLRLENGYALVRSPDGLRGWVDASTLETPADS